MLLRYFLLFVALYVAYKLVFEFAIPLYRTYRQVRRQFRGMSDHLQQDGQTRSTNGQDAHSQPRKTAPEKKPEAGDYIDFEEIK